MSHAILQSIQVGEPQEYVWRDPNNGSYETWTTAFFKRPIAGSVRATRFGLAGDGVADTRVHGGLDKALLAYSADHYATWSREWGVGELPPGAFGENLTLRGLDESAVSIGDVWRMGDVLLEVSQPRQPCWKLGRRWERPDLPRLVIAAGRTGWYFRVRREGEIQCGMRLIREGNPHPAWTVAQANRLMYDKLADRNQLQALGELPELSAAWREVLLERAARRPA